MVGQQVYVVHDNNEYSSGCIHGVYADKESADIAVEIESLRGQYWGITCCNVQTADKKKLLVAREERAVIDLVSQKNAKQLEDLQDACKDLERIPEWSQPTSPCDETWTARMDYVSKALTAEGQVRDRAKALGIADEKMIRLVLREIVPVEEIFPKVHLGDLPPYPPILHLGELPP